MTSDRASNEHAERRGSTQRDAKFRAGPVTILQIVMLSSVVAAGCGPDATPTPPQIVIQPASVTVNVCDRARFTVVGGSSPGIVYQWFRDGIAIPGETTWWHEISHASVKDSGHHYFVTLTTAEGATRSDEVTLTVDGRPGVPIVLSDIPANRLTVTATSIYWTSTGGVYEAPIECGVPVRTLYERSSVYERPVGLLVDGEMVYWSDQNIGFVARVPAAGGTPDLVARVQDPTDILRIGDRLYWGEPRGAAIQSRTVTGGPIEILPIGTYPANFTFITATDGIDLFWVDSGARTISTMPAGGGTITVLATGQESVHALKATGGFLFWTSTIDGWSEGAVGQVVAMNLATGATSVLASAPGGSLALAVDATHVYWSGWAGTLAHALDGGASSLHRVPLTGGTAETLATGLTYPVALEVDEDFVYVGEGDMAAGDGRIVKYAK